MMRDRFGARNPKSWQMRFHAQTAGVSLTAQQPMNNVVRTTVQALALPTAAAATLALRTQQVIAFESGVTDLVDPLGGSYAVERLTNDIEADARALIAEVDRRGGMVAAIDAGFPQREIAESAYREQRAIEQGEKIIVGTTTAAGDIDVFTIDDQAEARQRARMAELRAARDGTAVGVALQELAHAADGAQNTMPAILNAVRAYATVGEMCDTLRQVWGEYEEVPIV
jgi:methylmalonyl-CoA mutase N-terminal domain/subunit